MADARETIRQGEQRPFFVGVDAPGGTLTIQGTPTAVLYDAAGTPVPSHNGITASGFDAGALESVRAWLNLDTDGIAPGAYTLAFTIVAQASDGNPRKYVAAVGIDIESVLRVVGSPGGPASRYASLADVRSRVPAQLWTPSPRSHPTDEMVLGWLDAASAWIDTTLRWKYVVPVTEAADLALLRPICARLVAAQVWEVIGGHGQDQPSSANMLRKEARILLAYDPGSGMRPSSGQANIVLPNTALAVTGEAVVASPSSSFTDPDEGGADRLFSMGMVL